MISCRIITEATSEYYRVPVRDLHSQRRPADVVHARQMGWYLARYLTTHSFAEIAMYMGGRDHSTVLSGIRQMECKVAGDPATARQAGELREAIALTEQALAAAKMLEMVANNDPTEIAERMLNQPIRDDLPSLQEVRDLALAVRFYAGELAVVRSELDALRANPAPPPDIELRKLALSVCQTSKALDNAVGSIAERHARTDLNRALNALRNHIAQEKQNV